MSDQTRPNPVASGNGNTQTMEINADRIERLLMGSTLTGENINVSFGDSYTSYSTVLLQQRLTLIPAAADGQRARIVAPSNIEPLVNALESSRLLIMHAPPFWRSSYVAEYLAYVVMRKALEQAGGDTDKVKPITYALTSEASGDALLDALRDDNYKLEDAVIIASGVLAKKYRGSLLAELAQKAKERGAYLILSTEEKQDQWAAALGQGNARFVDLVKESPYTNDDLTRWLMNNPDLRRWLHQVGVGDVSADKAINAVNMSIAQIAAQLGSPGALQQFLNEIQSSLAPQLDVKPRVEDLNDFLNRVKLQQASSVEERVQTWFNSLEESEKYLVLAISLLDGLQQETFWAIYEQLTQHAWRERDMQLAMTDYHDIKVRLDQFVSAVGDRVSFHNADERRILVSLALDDYRRSLVQALPVLADIVSGANEPVAHDSGSLAGRLRVLDIFGSELEPTGENRLRQERLRNSVANSIAQIAQREPSTTEHLLLAWASGVDNLESEIVNTRLRIAVIITLVQMLTIEAPTPVIKKVAKKDVSTSEVDSWYERHTAYKLLNQWYRRYNARRTVAYSQSALVTEDRHRNIRSTMALALCHFGRHMTLEDFGQTTDVTRALATSVPEKQPDADTIESPWHMLLALAWDPDSRVRSNILEGVPVLAQRHLSYAEQLIHLLATDWQTDVRLEVAELLAAMYARNPSRIYIVNNLLNTSSDIVARGVPAQADHYMRRDATANQYDYPLHLWTATMAMFYIGQQDESVFYVYLDTLIQGQATNTPLWKALEHVIRFILSNERLLAQFRENALLYLLTHTRADNSPSRVSQLLAAEMRTYVVHPTITRNTASVRERVGAWARGYYSALPEPTVTRLRNDLSRVEVGNEHIFALLEYYTTSNEAQVRRRVQHILNVKDNFVNQR